MTANPQAAAPTPPPQVGLVPLLMQEYGALTRRRLAEHLPRATPQRYLYNLLADYPMRGGKMMRSTICIATARAFGARTEDALPSATAIELIHNAILIHDDIEDGSLERRGRPTLHESHGIPLAINAGDSLTVLALQPLLENRRRLGSDLAERIFEYAMLMARETAEGQAMELGWRRDNVLELDTSDYLTLVHKKTCWLATIFPCIVGALIGSRGRVEIEPFLRFGFFLGAVFQIQDDLLNLELRPGYGKERDGDLWEGKRTLMLIRLLSVASDDEKSRIGDILQTGREQRSAEQVLWLRQSMDRHDCLDYARAVARGLAGAAAHEFALAFAAVPASRDRRFIESLAGWVLEREY